MVHYRDVFTGCVILSGHHPDEESNDSSAASMPFSTTQRCFLPVPVHDIVFQVNASWTYVRSQRRRNSRDQTSSAASPSSASTSTSASDKDAGNQSAVIADDDAAASPSARQVIDLVDMFQLRPVELNKPQFMKRIHAYLNRLTALLEATRPERLPHFVHEAMSFVRGVVATYDDWRCYVGPVRNRSSADQPSSASTSSVAPRKQKEGLADFDAEGGKTLRPQHVEHQPVESTSQSATMDATDDGGMLILCRCSEDGLTLQFYYFIDGLVEGSEVIQPASAYAHT
jgi:hypothetical protein